MTSLVFVSASERWISDDIYRFDAPHFVRQLSNRLPNFARLLGYNTLQTRRKHHSFSGNIQGDRKPLYSFSNSLLSEISQLNDMYARSPMSIPFLKETSYVLGNPL
jgi:hypothetical protein